MLAGCGREIAIVDLSATFGTEAKDHRLASVFLLNFNVVRRIHKKSKVDFRKFMKWTFFFYEVHF